MSQSIDDDAVALGTILESIPTFVTLVDLDGMIRYINRVEVGYERSEVLGTRVDLFLFPDSREVFDAAMRTVLDTGEPAEFEVEVTLADGTSAWYRSQMFPYREGAEIVHMVMMGTNITELKAAQKTVAQLRQLLPICSWCDRIQTGEGSWETIERYLGNELNTEVTHGMCTDCYKREVEGLDAQEGRGGGVA